MTENETRAQGMISLLIHQRNEALNHAAELAGEVALLKRKIEELSKEDGDDGSHSDAGSL